MAQEPFVPFGVEDEESYLALVDGVPRWLRPPLVNWVMQPLRDGNYVSAEVCLVIQLATRVDLGVSGAGISSIPKNILATRLTTLAAKDLLQIVDYRLSLLRHSKAPAVQELERILMQGSSKFRVGMRDGKLRLTVRELEGVQTAVEETLSLPGQASKMLSRAWSKLHALEPDHSGAYSAAVKAAEIASIGLVVPNKEDATLGDVAGSIAGDARWELPLRPHRSTPGHEVLAGMLRTLFSGHRDRHGRPDYSDVSPEETRAAILLATVIVDWFVSDGVRHRG